MQTQCRMVGSWRGCVTACRCQIIRANWHIIYIVASGAYTQVQLIWTPKKRFKASTMQVRLCHHAEWSLCVFICVFLLQSCICSHLVRPYRLPPYAQRKYSHCQPVRKHELNDVICTWLHMNRDMIFVSYTCSIASAPVLRNVDSHAVA